MKKVEVQVYGYRSREERDKNTVEGGKLLGIATTWEEFLAILHGALPGQPLNYLYEGRWLNYESVKEVFGLPPSAPYYIGHLAPL